jgi:hypothetical protein
VGTAGAAAQCELQKIRQDADGVFREFGRAVDVSLDTVLVGSSDSLGYSERPGGCTVFERDENAWVETANLVPSDLSSPDEYGYAVALANDEVWIGSPFHDDGGTRGSTYVFAYSAGSWSELQKVSSAAGSPGERFGSSLAIADGIAVVGAPASGPLGAAYVFGAFGG